VRQADVYTNRIDLPLEGLCVSQFDLKADVPLAGVPTQDRGLDRGTRRRWRNRISRGSAGKPVFDAAGLAADRGNFGRQDHRGISG
jgi:hypothetical protein